MPCLDTVCFAWILEEWLIPRNAVMPEKGGRRGGRKSLLGHSVTDFQVLASRICFMPTYHIGFLGSLS